MEGPAWGRRKQQTQLTSQMGAPAEGSPVRGVGLVSTRGSTLAHSDTNLPEECCHWLSCISEPPHLLGLSPTPRAEPQEGSPSPGSQSGSPTSQSLPSQHDVILHPAPAGYPSRGST